MSMQAIWLKILSGKPLTEAEELAWHNHWCEDYPSKPWTGAPNRIDGDQAILAQRRTKALG